MNSKKLFLIAGLALLLTIFLTIAAFRLAEPNQSPKIAPSSLPKDMKKSPQKEESKDDYVYLSKKGHKLIKTTLIKPISAKFGIEISVNQFSRCPSGIQYYQVNSPDKSTPYFEVQLINADGCQSTDLCLFKVNLEETSLEIWSKKDEKYISAEAFIAQLTAEDLNKMDLYEFEEEEGTPSEEIGTKTL